MVTNKFKDAVKMSDIYDDDHWCSECGHIGRPRLIDETYESATEEDGTIEIECQSCPAKDIINVSSGGYEGSNDILYNSRTEEFETRSEQRYNLLGKTDSKAESDPIFQQLVNKLCLLNLDGEIISIFTNDSHRESCTNITIVTKEPGEIRDVIEYIKLDNSASKYLSIHIDVLTQVELSMRDNVTIKASSNEVASKPDEES
jgi:hypothetical protein